MTILKELHGIDSRMTQLQRIVQVTNDVGENIHSMTNEELIELELDPQENLESGTFRIVDIRGEQYGSGAANTEYLGVFPMIVSAPMALYCQGKLEFSEELDEFLKLVDLDEGIEMSTSWFRNADPVDEDTKIVQAQMVESIHQRVNIDSTRGKFDRGTAFQNRCVNMFPRVNIPEIGKIDKAHLNEIGIIVCRLAWDSDLQETSLEIVESFVGKLGRTKDSIDRNPISASDWLSKYFCQLPS